MGQHGPSWGRQNPGGPHVGHVNPANWDSNGNLAKKREKEKSEYFKFVKIAWMAPGS